MTAKKRWLKKIYHDSQELKTSQEKISWSSSESDEDVFNKYIHTKKKKKVNTTNVDKKWIKPTSDNEKCYQQEYFTNINIETMSSISNVQYPINSDDSESKNLAPKRDLNKRSKFKKDNVEYVDTNIDSTKSGHNCDSPIINSLKLEELSPVLTQNSDNIDLTNEVSPILGRRSVLKKFRSNYKKKYIVKQQVFKPSNTSPDLFTTQSTQVIDCDSPEFCTRDNLSPIKPSTPPLTECIVPFPSQNGSEVKISDTSSSGSSSTLTKTDSSSLYHQPPQRKKNYKKGGLASLLQKALHLQRTRTSIWQHEIYTNKSDVDIDKREVIEFLIKKEWREYGNLLLECEVPDNKCSNIISSTSINDQSFIFIIVIGYSTTLNITYKSGCAYKLFPPYSIKSIIYKSREVPCYFNITKLILCKEKQPI